MEERKQVSFGLLSRPLLIYFSLSYFLLVPAVQVQTQLLCDVCGHNFTYTGHCAKTVKAHISRNEFSVMQRSSIHCICLFALPSNLASTVFRHCNILSFTMEISFLKSPHLYLKLAICRMQNGKLHAVVVHPMFRMWNLWSAVYQEGKLWYE